MNKAVSPNEGEVLHYHKDLSLVKLDVASLNNSFAKDSNVTTNYSIGRPNKHAPLSSSNLLKQIPVVYGNMYIHKPMQNLLDPFLYI